MGTTSKSEGSSSIDTIMNVYFTTKIGVLEHHISFIITLIEIAFRGVL